MLVRPSVRPSVRPQIPRKTGPIQGFWPIAAVFGLFWGLWAYLEGYDTHFGAFGAYFLAVLDKFWPFGGLSGEI